MTTAKGRAPRGRPRDPAIDRGVLAAALQLFIEGGFGHASMERVAKEAGVSKVTVYRRWPSKEVLIAAALQSGRDQISTSEWADDQSRTVAELIDTMVPEWAQRLAQPGFAALITRMISSRNDHPELVRAWWQQHGRSGRETARTVMERARRDGSLGSDVDVDLAIDMMTGAITYQLLLRPESFTADEAAAYLRKLLSGVGFRLSQR